MRFLILLAAIAAVALPAAADARSPHRSPEQDAAYRAREQGQILSLTTIRARIQVRGASFIGADFDPGSMIYRLKFIRDGEVIFVDVDARTGRILGRSS